MSGGSLDDLDRQRKQSAIQNEKNEHRNRALWLMNEANSYQTMAHAAELQREAIIELLLALTL